MPITIDHSTLRPNANYKREIAALEFLPNIPLEAEYDIVHSGWLQQHGLKEEKEMNETVRNDGNVEVLEPPNTQTREIPTTSRHGTSWWEKWINNPSSKPEQNRGGEEEEEELEQPHQIKEISPSSNPVPEKHLQVGIGVVHAPGRRLEGDDAIRIQIPLKVDTVTRQRSIARMAVTREWELQVAHGLGSNFVSSPPNARSSDKTSSEQVHPPMLDGRLFFSASGSYPTGVFSMLRYEPKKEELARRRQKIEARGGGGTVFFQPARDWRGISYRALLPLRNRTRLGTSDEESAICFDRFVSSKSTPETSNKDDGQKPVGRESEETQADGQHEKEDDIPGDNGDESDEEVDTYIAGLLDDPAMVLGRHRNVMIGDRTTGCIVSSTIQFVKPKLLKADLNKQFRERFDGWEPPKSQRKYIGARVIDGIYTLMDPGGTDDSPVPSADQPASIVMSPSGNATTRSRQGSVSSVSAAGDPMAIRMPPSLTLSKIRSLKQQALRVAVKAKLEISTVALSICYFERLCLDCRVDKSNRRLSFAACLLLAMKINEAHVGLVMTKEGDEVAKNTTTTNRLQSFVRPTKKSSNMFASLLEFFTQEWDISLKHLFKAEWGVFAALQFRLHAKPSQVAFHFKRLLKSLDWNPSRYLGREQFGMWQQALLREEFLRQEREAIRELRQQKEEQKKLLQIQREIERREKSTTDDEINDESRHDKQSNATEQTDQSALSLTAALTPRSNKRQTTRLSLGILNRFGGISGKRSMSTNKLNDQDISESSENRLSLSPSMPTMSDLISQNKNEMSSDQHFIQGDSDQQANEYNDDEISVESSHSETSVIMI